LHGTFTLDERDPQAPEANSEAFIFFADVCQSTVLYDRLGDEEAADLMMRCLEQTATHISDNHGRLIETRGDEVLCLFDDAGDALQAAREIHELVRQDQHLASYAMAFRIGIHHGPLIESGGNLYGDAVNVAARLAAKAKADQTVLSGEVLARFPDQLENQVRPLGAASVRGKRGTRELFELLNQSATGEITEVSSREQSEKRSFLLTLNFENRQKRLTPVLVRHLLGRGKDCDLRVDHPSVSRHHAEIRFRNGHFYLFDVSTNGSRVRTDSGAVTVHRSDLRLPQSGKIILGRTETEPRLQISFVTDEI